MSVWPPPPDLHSIRELVRAADPESHLAEGAPADEYDPEEEAIYSAISDWPTARLTPENLLPVIEEVWEKSFGADPLDQAKSRPGLIQLANQIARFFGPEAQPQVRTQPATGEEPTR